MAGTFKSQLMTAPQTLQSDYNKNLIEQQRLANQASYLKMAQASPAFTIGNLIGNILYDGYNRRGVRKEKEFLGQALDKYKQTQTDYNSANSALTSIGNTDGNSIISGSIGDVPQLGNSLGTPQGDISNFDLNKFKAQYYEDARKRNRPQEQIDEAWASMAPQLQGLDTQAKDARANTALSTLTPNENGQYSFGEMSMANPQFVQWARQYAKDDPTMATVLIKQAQAKDSAKLTTAENQMKFANNVALANIKNQGRLNAAIAKAQLGGKNGANGKFNTAYFNAANKVLTNLEKKYTGLDGVKPVNQWDPSDAAKYKALNQTISGMLGFREQQGDVTIPSAPKQQGYVQPNINNYNQDLIDDIGLGIATLSKKGYPKSKIIQGIKAMYGKQIQSNGGNAGYIDQILAGVDWGPNGYNVKIDDPKK